MKIKYNDKFDIYCHGNYITSYDTETQVEEFFKETYKTQMRWKDMTGTDPITYMNNQRFSVIKSKWPVFSED